MQRSSLEEVTKAQIYWEQCGLAPAEEVRKETKHTNRWRILRRVLTAILFICALQFAYWRCCN